MLKISGFSQKVPENSSYAKNSTQISFSGSTSVLDNSIESCQLHPHIKHPTKRQSIQTQGILVLHPRKKACFKFLHQNAKP